MQTHVKVLGVLFLALSAVGVCFALFLIVALGAATGVVGAAADPHDAAIALPVIGIAGSALAMFILMLSLPGIVTGIGLLKYKPWARILGIVLSAINLINFPIGTALGIYGLWVLLNRDTEPLFANFATGLPPSPPTA
jgi:hypothetical protein